MAVFLPGEHFLLGSSSVAAQLMFAQETFIVPGRGPAARRSGVGRGSQQQPRCLGHPAELSEAEAGIPPPSAAGGSPTRPPPSHCPQNPPCRPHTYPIKTFPFSILYSMCWDIWARSDLAPGSLHPVATLHTPSSIHPSTGRGRYDLGGPTPAAGPAAAAGLR